MAIYNYTGLEANGTATKGILEADSAKGVRAHLRSLDLTPVSVEQVTRKIKNNPLQKFASYRLRLARADLCLFTRQLATLLAAGMPVEEALQACAEQTDKAKVAEVILGVRSKVLEGHSLAHGLKEYPRAFSQLYTATVGSGEESGHLDQILERLADHLERQHAMTMKIQQALLYPAIMSCISILIVIFLLIFVVPKMIGVFSGSGQELPLITQVLLGISSGVQHFGIYVLGIATIAGIVLNWLLRKNLKLRTAFHKLLLLLPLIGKTIKKINTARFSRTMGILSNASVAILDAMTTANQLVRNIPIATAIQTAINDVREGSKISLALKRSKYFSPMSIHLIASGEASGKLETMLERSAQVQEQEVTRFLDILLTLFEPILILIMGSVVLFIVLAILLPIFTLNQLVGL